MPVDAAAVTRIYNEEVAAALRIDIIQACTGTGLFAVMLVGAATWLSQKLIPAKMLGIMPLGLFTCRLSVSRGLE